MRTRVSSIVLASALGLGGVATGLVLAPGAASAAGSGTSALGDRLDRIKDALTGLVDDGTISQDQADAVAQTLDESLPQGRGGGSGGRGGFGGGRGGLGGGFGGGHGGGLRGLDTAATTLGVTRDELRTALEGGKSLADVAADEGVQEQVLVDALVAQAQERLTGHAEDPGLTDAQVAERKAEITERITALVERQGLPVGGGHRGSGRDKDDDDDAAAEDAPTPTPSATS